MWAIEAAWKAILAQKLRIGQNKWMVELYKSWKPLGVTLGIQNCSNMWSNIVSFNFNFFFICMLCFLLIYSNWYISPTHAFLIFLNNFNSNCQRYTKVSHYLSVPKKGISWKFGVNIHKTLAFVPRNATCIISYYIQ